jgi:hypothetical protein
LYIAIWNLPPQYYLSSVSADELASKLTLFYYEAKPLKSPNKDYNKDTLKGIHAAINRRFSDTANDKTFL